MNHDTPTPRSLPRPAMIAFEPCPPGWFTLHIVYGTDANGNESTRTYRRRVVGWGVRVDEVFPLVTNGPSITEPDDDSFYMLWHTGDSYCTCRRADLYAPERGGDDPWWCDRCEGEIPK